MMWQAFTDCRVMPGGWRMHPTAIVDRTATILPGSYIGPNVTIAEHCTIGANTVIGAPGFGYETSSTGQHTYRPHSQGVVLERDVSVGSNTCIDQGRHRATIVGEGTKVDNLVHIAHNAIIGRHCLIIAHTMIAGSAQIGDYTQVSPGSLIRDWHTVGDHSIVGMGSVVVKDVPCGETWCGNPARPL